MTTDTAPESLDRLGIEAGTDKSRLRHDYLRHYDRLMQPFREQQATLIEIGVHNGASLDIWERYFPRAKIVGLDIVPGTKRFARDRVDVRIGSQADPEFLDAVGAELKPDIVVDDGSHIAEHQILSFQRLMPHLRPGGVYVVEDLARSGAATTFFLGLAAKVFAKERPYDIAALEIIAGAVFLTKQFVDELDRDAVALEAIVRASRRPGESLFYLAEHRLRGGAAPDAVLRIAEEASALAPANRWVHMLVSKLKLQQGDLAEAWRRAQLAQGPAGAQSAAPIQAHFDHVKALMTRAANAAN